MMKTSTLKNFCLTALPFFIACSSGGADDLGDRLVGGDIASGATTSAGATGGIAAGASTGAGAATGAATGSGASPSVEPLPPVDNDPTPGEDTDAEEVLRASLQFYGSQRSGATHNRLIGSCFAGDTHMGNDVSGGWHDAGDHIKFSFTIGYAAYTLLKAYDAFPDAFDDAYDEANVAPNSVADVLDEVKVATDYLVKAHYAKDKMLARVGSKSTSHQAWVSCDIEDDASPDKGGPARQTLEDVSAGATALPAAALALMSTLYPDAALAANYLQHARELYDLAKANKSGYNDPESMYSSNWGVDDDLACAAVELYRATGEGAYLTEAKQFEENAGNHNWTLDHDNVHDLCRHSLALVGDTAAQERWKMDVVGDGMQNFGYAGRVRSGMFHIGKEWGTLRSALGAGFSAALYASLTGDASAAAFAESQVDYVAGNNKFGRSFIIGVGENYPQNPHHRTACGCTDVDTCSADSNGPCTNKQELYGALVGGPRDPDGTYTDVMNDYVANEVAIDYNAGLVGTAAFLVDRERGN